MTTTQSKAVNAAAHKLGLSPKLVNGAYIGFWKFIRAHIQELPLKEDMSPEEFSKLKTNFNIPSLGKLYCTYERWKKIKSLRYEGNSLEKHNTPSN